MVENLYMFLKAIGFSHPLHPMLTHIPMGMIIAMVVFGLCALIWQNETFGQTAFHCSVLALLSILPVIATGTLDWLQFQRGEWNTLIIIKMILAALLTVLLTAAVIIKKQGWTEKKIFLVYMLCLACAGGLGYSGGELVYG